MTSSPRRLLSDTKVTGDIGLYRAFECSWGEFLKSNSEFFADDPSEFVRVAGDLSANGNTFLNGVTILIEPA